MAKTLSKVIQGYSKFREKYVLKDNTLMKQLSENGQRPQIVIVSCCDSRVDPALLLQCDPGDLFIVRNVANIIPPYENDEAHHGTSAALEFGICHLEAKHLIILGHSQCGGIHALLNKDNLKQDDFISNWTDLIKIKNKSVHDTDTCAKFSLINSYHNALTFPWIKEKLEQNKLTIHLWFFEIKDGLIYSYSSHEGNNEFKPLEIEAA